MKSYIEHMNNDLPPEGSSIHLSVQAVPLDTSPTNWGVVSRERSDESDTHAIEKWKLLIESSGSVGTARERIALANHLPHGFGCFRSQKRLVSLRATRPKELSEVRVHPGAGGKCGVGIADELATNIEHWDPIPSSTIETPSLPMKRGLAILDWSESVSTCWYPGR